MSKVSVRGVVGFLLGFSLIACQSGNVGGGANKAGVKSPKTLQSKVVIATSEAGVQSAMDSSQEDELLTQGELDAQSAFDRGDKRLIGVQTRGVSIPGVQESVISKVRVLYGISLRPVTDVIKSEDDRNTLTEVFQYVRQYNGKMAELLADEL